VFFSNLLRLAEGARAEAMQAKALTNLTETLCWNSPSAALDIGDRAVELNNEVCAPIEVGKANVARAIALSRLGRFEEACDTARLAVSIHERCAYSAGRLFGWQAEGVALCLWGKWDAAFQVLERIDTVASHIGVYTFLSVPLKLCVLEGAAEVWRAQFQWLGFDRTIAALADILPRRRSRPSA
jgi:tetratricopeptide (TPR) repeat protein